MAEEPQVNGRAVVTGVRVAVATARGLRDRNEDAVGVAGWALTGTSAGAVEFTVPVPASVAVVDGMGGAPDGDRAARLAAEHLTAPGAAVPAVVAEVDVLIRTTGTGASTGMACTAALVSVSASGTAVVTNVGDVRVYRLRDSYAGQLSEDHRATGSVVSRCLGGIHQTSAEPSTVHVDLRPGDRLILCSDGVHDAVDASVIGAAGHRTQGRTAAAELVAAAIATQHGDNATVAVLDVLGPTRREVPTPEPEAPRPEPLTEQPQRSWLKRLGRGRPA